MRPGSPVDPFVDIADGEELVAAACAAVAHRLAGSDELHLLAAAHLQAATALHARPRRRWRELHVTLAATLASSMGGELGALVWLRRREQRLLDGYMALEGSTQLTPLERQRLRRYLVPGAFERFARVDRLIMQREERGAYA